VATGTPGSEHTEAPGHIRAVIKPGPLQSCRDSQLLVGLLEQGGEARVAVVADSESTSTDNQHADRFGLCGAAVSPVWLGGVLGDMSGSRARNGTRSFISPADRLSIGTMERANVGQSSVLGIAYRWAAATDVGKRRQVNEDSYGAFDGLFVVADGMGGHAAGDVASKLAVAVVERYADLVPLSLEQVSELVAEANGVVRNHALTDGPDGMGTTMVGVAAIDNAGEPGLAVFNVGDSRCYELVDGVARRVTTDHSLVQELVDAGTISEGEAETHPERNVVTRAIGIEDKVAADFVVLDPTRVTRLLLCSDGVSGELRSDELSNILGTDGSPDAVAEMMIGDVLQRAARDNATVIVIDVDSSQLDAEANIGLTGPRRVVNDDMAVTGPRPTPANGTTNDSGNRLLDDVPAGVVELVRNDAVPRVSVLIDAVPLGERVATELLPTRLPIESEETNDE